MTVTASYLKGGGNPMTGIDPLPARCAARERGIPSRAFSAPSSKNSLGLAGMPTSDSNRPATFRTQ